MDLRRLSVCLDIHRELGVNDCICLVVFAKTLFLFL